MSVVMTPWPHLIWFFFNTQEYFQVHSSHQQTISTHGWRVICKIHRPLCPDSHPVLTLGSHISLPGVKCISSCIAAPSCLSDKFEELGRGRLPGVLSLWRASQCSVQDQHPGIIWILCESGWSWFGFCFQK